MSAICAGWGLSDPETLRRLLTGVAPSVEGSGDKFDIRGFHDEVLGAGSLPLDVLEQRIDAWIAAQKKA